MKNFVEFRYVKGMVGMIIPFFAAKNGKLVKLYFVRF